MIDKSKVWIVVPVGKREKYLPALIDTLNEYLNQIIFINNKENYSKFYGVNHIEDFDEINIHRWWNKGLDFAKSKGAEYVVIMNDDISFNKNLISSMIDKMVERKAEVCGIVNHAGVFFIIKTDSNIRADENLRWWCGDGDIFRQALERRSLIWYLDNSFIHYELNKQTDEDSFLLELGRKDLETYKNKLKSLDQEYYWIPQYVID